MCGKIQIARLLRAVLEDLKVSEFLAECRALGLISRIITSPLWRVLESDISILDMNEKYSHMIQCMERWAQNAEALLTGTAVVFEDTPIKKDEIWEALTKSAENDTLTRELLQVLLHFCWYTLEDHLPGGEHDNPSENKKSQLYLCLKRTL